MHGVKFTFQTPEAIAARKAKERPKVVSYVALTEDVLSRKKARDWSKQAFDLTTQLLTINPEFYTVWNYRRNILRFQIFPNSSPAEINDALTADLELTMAALKIRPKVYWIWNHRLWCLENVPDGPPDEGTDVQGWKNAHWAKELFVVEKMLDSDARNFHAWNYRRYVLASMPVKKSKLEELAYTTRKIESNFSNFSAWHQRTKLYSRLWATGESNELKAKDEEFELVKQAMYTDPSDQSVWLYHRWLIGSGENRTILEREISSIQELFEIEPDSKWCLESLAYYKQLLLQNHRGSLGADEVLHLTQRCMESWRQLESIDPQRRRRYQEIADSIRTL